MFFELLKLLYVVHLLRLEVRVTVESTCILVVPLAGNFEIVATAFTSQFFDALNDLCTMALIPMLFVDSEVDDTEILRVVARRMLAFRKREKANSLTIIAEEFDELEAVFEGYVDIEYRADRTLIVEKSVSGVDPELAADRAVSIATRGEGEAANGTVIDVPAESLCIHGDNPNSVEVLETIHDRFEEEGIKLKRLDAL